MTALEAFNLIINTPLEFWDGVRTYINKTDFTLSIFLDKNKFKLYMELTKDRKLTVSSCNARFDDFCLSDRIFGSDVILFENFFEEVHKFSVSKAEEIFKSLLTPTTNEEDNF